MRSPADHHLQALLAAERYAEAFAAAETALATLAEHGPTGDARGGIEPARARQALEAHAVAVEAALYLGHGGGQRHAFEALRVAKELGDLGEQARAHNALAVTFGAEGLYEKAAEHLWTVVHLREQAGARIAPQELNNLALVHVQLKGYDEASALFRRAVEGFEAAGDSVNAALARVNLAATMRDGGNASDALSVLNDALRAFEERGLKGHVVSTLANIGLAQAALHRPDRALASLQGALALVAAGHGARHEAALHAAIGRVALEAGDAAGAVTHLERAALGLGAEVTPGLEEVWSLLSRALGAVGRTEAALAALRSHVAQLERSAERSVSAAARVRLLELEYGVGGDQEIARLRAVELERVNASLGRRAAELERLSLTDPLTSLPNRRGFDARLREEVARAWRHGDGLVLALLDFDRFKGINDRFGHDAGDAVLVRGAGIVRALLRASDVATRWGGEEFALLLPGVTTKEARTILERLRIGVEKAVWSDVRADLQPTVSVGAAALMEVEDERQLLLLADRRLALAKRAGRNRVVVDDTVASA